MRIDQYLKLSRIVKRRSLAQQLAVNGRVFVNGKTAKPAREIRPGDIITITYGQRRLSVRVTGIPEKSGRKDSPPVYEVVMEKDDAASENDIE